MSGLLAGVHSLRRQLHRSPELSGHEQNTARRVVEFFEPLRPDLLLEDLGGCGVAVRFSGRNPGPTVLLRCELDALPIADGCGEPFQSERIGVGHQCGHDGHMAILAAVGSSLSANRPPRGRVVLLFQPAEETGQGAHAVMDDPRFERIRPEYSFALHNVPGYRLGEILCRAGTFACASRGITITLEGATAHAAYPDSGRSPTRAMTEILEGYHSLPSNLSQPGELAFATIIGARLGEKAFGTAPGRAEVWITLRSETDETMERFVQYGENLVQKAVTSRGITASIVYEDVFPATVNTERGAEIVRRAAGEQPVRELEGPFPWSEDFGRFLAHSEGAMFGIGAGEGLPGLHHEDYAFPDELIPRGADLFRRILDECLHG